MVFERLEKISNELYDYYLPIITEKEDEEEKVRLEKMAVEERNDGLNYQRTYDLTSDITIRDIQDSFTDDYPYLRIGVFMVQTGAKADKDGGAISPISNDTLLGKVRSFKGDCFVTVCGNDTPQSIEKTFRSISGLVVKICGNDENNDRFYISKDLADYKTSIYDLNAEYKLNGYYKADIS